MKTYKQPKLSVEVLETDVILSSIKEYGTDLSGQDIQDWFDFEGGSRS